MTFKFKTQLKLNYGLKPNSFITMHLSRGWIPHIITKIDEEGRIFGIEENRTEEEYLFSLHHIPSFLKSNELKIGLYRENESKDIR